MADYTSNFAALLTGHLGLPSGGGVDDVSSKYKPQNRTTGETSLDISDLISHAVAGGYTSFSDDSIRSNFKYLSGIIGQDKARKLFNQAFIYNQRPDAKQKSAEQKIQSFYEIGSADPETNKTLQSIKNWGAGSLARFNQSVYEGNQQMIGKTKKPINKDNTEQTDQLLTVANKKITL
jgi:hypothetical protein